MARIAAFTELQPADRRRPHDVRYDQRRGTSPIGDVVMEQIFEKITTAPPQEMLRRIASPPNIRRDKVLDIRRQIAEGTYEVADRLDGVIERLLEAITPSMPRHSCRRHDDSKARSHAVPLSGHCE